MFKFYNKNPFNRRIDDCVIRSISLLTDKGWGQTYDELAFLAAKQGYTTDNVEFVEDYLDDRYERECPSMTVGEFASKHPYGKYAITMKGHITSLINGVIYDTFDPSDRVMRCAWKIKET